MANSMEGQARNPADNVAATLNQAMIAHRNGRLDEAEHLYRAILRADGTHFDALHMLAVVESQRGKFEEGEKLIRQALQREPRSAEAHSNLGLILKARGRREEALASFEQAVSLNPHLVIALSNRGVMLRELGRCEEALASYDRALAVAPTSLDTLFNRGNVLLALRRPQDALAAFDAALACQPGYVDARMGRASALQDMGRDEEALENYNAAVAARPNHAEAYRLRGNLLMERRVYRNAAADFAAALQLDGNSRYALGQFVHCRMQTCDWAGLSEARAALSQDVQAGRPAAVPFVLLAADPSPANQLACARTFSAERYTASAAAPPRRDRRHDKIRLAYVSADLREHAVAFLTAGLFEQHDRTRFETTAISLTPEQPSPMLDRLKAAFDRFVTVADKTDAEVTALMRDLEIDIAVDLTGYTQSARTGILAARAAPVQVNYLGFPGTMGADYIDYIIADPFVVPPGAERFYAEKIVRLPDTFQINDSLRVVPPETPARSDVGLPEQGVVYAAFNGAHKLTPEMFDLWMRILQQVEGSVLWLASEDPGVIANLGQRAQSDGIAPERLVFAPRLPYAGHLARLRLADVCLDTFPFNGGTNTSDALWMGVPVVTLTGAAFASRMSGSLLRAVGLAELSVQATLDYEALAVKLGQDADLLAETKARLARSRSTGPLFDTQCLTRHLEAAYLKMWEGYERGAAPESFSVDPIG